MMFRTTYIMLITNAQLEGEGLTVRYIKLKDQELVHYVQT